MYEFKPVELLWAGGAAAFVFILEIAVKFDPEIVSDWQTWAISLGGGCIRAAAGGIIALIATRKA